MTALKRQPMIKERHEPNIMFSCHVYLFYVVSHKNVINIFCETNNDDPVPPSVNTILEFLLLFYVLNIGSQSCCFDSVGEIRNVCCSR